MTTSSRERLIKEWAILKKRQEAFRKSPYWFYEPWGQQVDFEQSPARIRILTGSRRSGKSTEGQLECIAHALGARHDGSKRNIPPPPTHGIAIFRDFSKINEVFMAKLKEWAVMDWIENVKNGSTGAPELLTWKNGSTIRLASHHQDEDSFESVRWHWAWFDEPPPQRIWVNVWGGLTDYGGKAWMTFTPRNCPWILNDIVNKADGIRISVHHILLKDNPHISEQAKQEFYEGLAPDEVDSLWWGKFSHLSGTIFPEFDRGRHVISARKPPQNCPVFMAMDPHDRRPSYIFWAYVDERDRLVIFDEWPKEPFWEMKTSKRSVNDYAAIIRGIEGPWAKQVVERVIDPRFGRTNSVLTGTNLVEEFQEYGLDFLSEIVNDITTGHQKIHNLLGTGDREPGLLIGDNCMNMIWAFSNYVWLERDMEQRFSARERPDETGKDQIDALRYLLDYGPTYAMGSRGDDAEIQLDYGLGYGQ